MKRIYIFFGVILFSLALAVSCGNNRDVMPYLEVGDISAVVAETAQQISRIHYPAHTRFSLSYEPVDDFGSALVAKMREMGFAIAEGGTEQGTPITYLAELEENTANFRVQVNLGTEAFSCLYHQNTAADGKITYSRIGAWARKLK